MASRLRNWLQRRLVLPAALLLRGEHRAYEMCIKLAEFEFDRTRLDAHRERHLRALLRHASSTVPFYSRRNTATEEHLEAYGILEKNDLVSHAAELRSTVVRRATPKTTGGSTGRAVTVWKNAEAIAAERAATWMAFQWYGIRPGDPAIRFWGTGGSRQRRIRGRLADLAMNRTVLSAFAFDEQSLLEYWKRIGRYRPLYLYGYVSMLEVMARTALTHELDCPVTTLKAVITTSEPLFANQRKLISQAFGVPVWNEYGCGEVGPIAYECERGSMHLMEQNLWLEVIDAEGRAVDAGTGELLVTDLTNRAMPLIRYRVGDTVTLGRECECGRAFRTISAIEGRTYDFLEDADGRRYHGEAVMYILEDLRDRGLDIREIQVRQEQAGRAVVLFISPDDSEVVSRALCEGFRGGLGGIVVDAQEVEHIDRATSGKRRLIMRT